MNEFNAGIFNSSLVLNYLLRKKSDFILYLEDGAKLSGTLLGWDSDFLLIKDGKYLQMVRINKILRLQAEMDQISAVDSAAVTTEYSSSSNADKTMASGNTVPPKLKPVLTEVKTPATGAENSGAKGNDFKERLDNLVRNW
ncbi:MAG: hypothetical protein GX075_13225 [Firmicutes bacterium]|nr:hypothetical protein [Bacillota bacterium]